MKSTSSLLRRLLRNIKPDPDGSTLVDAPEIIAAFDADPDNTYLVSFPRTGSHWLRMVMELYFERPSLLRVFYYPKRDNYLTLHTHDRDLTCQRRDVIYLYRDPVDTVFSQLNYRKESLDSVRSVCYWADIYGEHLAKWLINDNFTRHKTVITYEGMRADLVGEFSKVAAHFGQPLDTTKLRNAAERIDKDEVKRKTTHDTQVIARDDDYSARRHRFREEFTEAVWKSLLARGERLADFFERPMRAEK